MAERLAEGDALTDFVPVDRDPDSLLVGLLEGETDTLHDTVAESVPLGERLIEREMLLDPVTEEDNDRVVLDV